MISVCQSEIVYKHLLYRKPTERDMELQLGLDEFSEALKRYGWCARDGTNLKTFRVYQMAGSSYIEWCATIMN